MTASPAPIVLLATIEGSNDLEVAVQRRFASDKIKGEWFRLSEGVCAFIAQMQQEGRRYQLLEDAEREFRVWISDVLKFSNGCKP